jgi:hypothetical protein
VLHDLAVDVVVRSVLQEVIALREQVDTLTQEQLRQDRAASISSGVNRCTHRYTVTGINQPR